MTVGTVTCSSIVIIVMRRSTTLSMAVIAGNKGASFTGIDSVDHIRSRIVMAGCAGESAVGHMFHHDVCIMAVGAAG